LAPLLLLLPYPPPPPTIELLNPKLPISPGPGGKVEGKEGGRGEVRENGREGRKRGEDRKEGHGT